MARNMIPAGIIIKPLLFSILVILGSVCVQADQKVLPPKAKKENHTMQEHGHVRIDPYHWLNQRDNPEVIAYLKAENDYTRQKMQATEQLQKTLYQEFRNRIKEDDSTVPYKMGSYFYYTRVEKNKDYAIYCRKKNTLNNPEEIILDVNLLAKDHEYYEVSSLKISPNENLLAFSEDIEGRRKYKIKIKDLASGEMLKDVMSDTADSIEWANDSKTLFYVKLDPTSLREYQIYNHKLNLPIAEDKLIFEEKDDTFSVDLLKSHSKQYLMIESFKKDTSEFQILDANHPDGDFRIFAPRRDGIEYYIEHHRDRFFILTNENAPNFKLMQSDLTQTDPKHWQPFVTLDPEIYLEAIFVYHNFLALEERKNGLVKIKIYPFSKEAPYYIEFEEPDYDVSISDNLEFTSDEIRFSFSSLKTPQSVYDFDIKTKQKSLKKQSQILGGFEANHYQVERLFAIAKEGIKIPISVVYRKDKLTPHQNPLLLTGYGAYGITDDPAFDPYVISLLDRGFVYAIAHIRGGSELGRAWYLQGKLFNKKNTFNDFITVAEYLGNSEFCSPSKIYAYGASAGGLLVGAVINMRPTLFKGVIAEVPFVDVMNTMLDPDLPLTTQEYAEWGNPHDKLYYETMLSYSPYDNVSAKNYPNILVLCSYHDSQVQYWEAAKWVAKLRDLKTDQHLLLLRTIMNAGHSGASGRYETYREQAFAYAFLLSQEGYNSK